MNKITIPKGEFGQVRVFEIDIPRSEIEAELMAGSKQALASRLLGHEIPKGSFEIFDLADLTGVGLPHYLIEGLGITSDQIDRDREKLRAAEGFALVLFSRAFDNTETVLNYGDELSLIGTYAEAQADMRQTTIESEAAQPYTGSPAPTPPAPAKGAPGRTMAIVGAIILVLLLIWLLL